MKFLSFNINSIRIRLHQIKEIIKKHNPEIIALQETRVDNNLFPVDDIFKLGYKAYYYGKKGYCGVAFLSKICPFYVLNDFPNYKENNECRIITIKISTYIGNITLINIYAPQGENRNNYIKFNNKSAFFLNLYIFLKRMINPKELIIIMGDMNISMTNNDIGIGEKNRLLWLKRGKCSFLPEERSWMQKIFDWGFIDAWRFKNINNYFSFSWFDYRSYGFLKNKGLRIDYILISKPLIRYYHNTGIDYYIRNMNRPSDHAPIWIELDI
ncbi:Exodeoxyribonuclease III [Candidatus Purcelliella pentastirinorum]|uniref:Exodeoxyribonuclease III n=1 Tax=Candidatus Purcelliella pentastirinorum TaxID=472834 RepID=A0A346DZ64_9ENTR|nr:exodeoxyribonuclease III [Candidatus Purcelliella pentastirinorum]AXN02019.1 Exodeoxyribonuclease III [Candidatus Purcelliella pentastirinorum]